MVKKKKPLIPQLTEKRHTREEKDKKIEKQHILALRRCDKASLLDDTVISELVAGLPGSLRELLIVAEQFPRLLEPYMHCILPFIELKIEAVQIFALCAIDDPIGTLSLLSSDTIVLEAAFAPWANLLESIFRSIRMMPHLEAFKSYIPIFITHATSSDMFKHACLAATFYIKHTNNFGIIPLDALILKINTFPDTLIIALDLLDLFTVNDDLIQLLFANNIIDLIKNLLSVHSSIYLLRFIAQITTPQTVNLIRSTTLVDFIVPFLKSKDPDTIIATLTVLKPLTLPKNIYHLFVTISKTFDHDEIHALVLENVQNHMHDNAFRLEVENYNSQNQ